MAMLIQSTIAMSVRSKQHNKRKINKLMNTKMQNSPMEDSDVWKVVCFSCKNLESSSSYGNKDNE